MFRNDLDALGYEVSQLEVKTNTELNNHRNVGRASINP
jgi:hypothetical protein